MTTHIRTRWHYVMPLVDADEVYLTAPSDGRALHWSEYNCEPKKLKALLRQTGDLPRFVIDRELLELAQKMEYSKSLLDMKKAGVLRLPFPALTVEFEHETGAHEIVLLRDAHHEGVFPWEEGADKNEHLPLLEQAGDPDIDYYGIRLSIEKDEGGHYLTVSPSVVMSGVSEGENGEPWVKITGFGSEIAPSNPKTEALINKTYRKDAGNVFYAACAAYLLMATAGVSKEVIETKKINRTRLSNGKPAIPKHTYIRIGHVYRSESSSTSDKYEARRSPRPHWRRGFNRRTYYGVGRKQMKWTYFPPMLVAYHGDVAKAKQPSYVVSK